MFNNAIISILGLLVSIVSTVIAIVQTKHKKLLEEKMRHIRRAHKLDLWTNISIVLRSYESITIARDEMLKEDFDISFVLSKVSSARRGTVDQWRSLIKEAVLNEPNFNEDTIKKWIKSGRLENEWRVEQVRRLMVDLEDEANA